MSHFEDLRKHKELINLRESARYSWREELSEGKDEHPYVEVMPSEKTGEEKPKKKEKKEEEKKEEVKEGFKLTPNTQFREGLSIDDQMRIAREHNRKSKEEKLAANKAALGNTKKVAPKKDTRTDAQKMTDATGPRPGSRYRGD